MRGILLIYVSAFVRLYCLDQKRKFYYNNLSMLRLITGADEAQKTEYIIKDLAARSEKKPECRFIFVVPEQFTLETQKNVLRFHPRHACMNIDVVSFNRLAVVALAKMGINTASVLDETGKALVLRNVLDKCRDELVFYKGKARMEGFLMEMESTLSELHRYGADDNTLFLMQEKAAGAGERILYNKLQDIRLIYERFREEIKKKYTTAEEVLGVFKNNISSSDFLNNSEIYLDGFTGFSPVQFGIIGELLEKTECVSCALTIPKEKAVPGLPETDVFHLSCDTYLKLKDIAAKLGLPVEHIFVPETTKKTEDVHIRRLENPEAECGFAAEKILKLVRGGMRFRDIAVLTPDMEGYYAQILKTFTRAGIPVFIDHKAAIPGNTLIRFLLAAIDIKTDNMPFDAVFAFLKTGYSPLEGDDICYLENYCLEYGIRGVNAWKKPFEANRTVFSTGDDFWNLERVNALREIVFEILEPFLKSCRRTGDKAGTCVEALKGLLAACGVREKTQKLAEELENGGNSALSQQYGQIFEQTVELLDKIALLMADEVLPLREFKEILISGFSEIKTGTIPPVLDVVTAGDLNRTRLGDIKVLFVLGCSDGNLPQVNKNAGLFSGYERSFLKTDFELAPDVFEDLCMQRFYLYLCFNRPKERLYLTWPARSAAGEEFMPTGVFEELPELIRGSCSVNKKDEDSGCKGRKEGRLAAALREFVKTSREGAENAEVLQEAAGLLKNCDAENARKILDGALYSNVRRPLDAGLAAELYGDVLKGSISRFEKYYECPYMHFLTYGMGLKERKVYEIQAANMGTIYHDALERYSKRLAEEGLSFRNVDDERSHEISDLCAQEAISGQPGDIFSSTARNSYFQNRIKQITRKTTDALRAQVRAGRFEPEDFEYMFAEKISDGKIRFSGKIDRIDVFEDAESGNVFVKIIDYKSGSKEFSETDIYDGVQLQLAAYMDQALKETKRRHPDAEVKPGGIYYYLINDKFVKNDDENRKKYQMKGLTLSEYDIPEAMDSDLGGAGTSSGIIQVGYDKNGFSRGSRVAGEDEFKNLISFAEKKIEEAGENIMAGDVKLEPRFENARENACRFCEHRDICRFEAGNFGTDIRPAAEADVDEIKRALYGGN